MFFVWDNGNKRHAVYSPRDSSSAALSSPSVERGQSSIEKITLFPACGREGRRAKRCRGELPARPHLLFPLQKIIFSKNYKNSLQTIKIVIPLFY